MVQKPLISIVIPTKNSGKVLRQCLQSIKGQAYGRLEIIIVDAHSRDGTESIARSFGARFITAPGTPPVARNLGFSKAKGAIFVSIDSDMLLEPGLLAEVAALMKNHDALILSEVGHGKNFLSRCKDLEKRCYLGDEEVESVRAFSSRVFRAVGGYDAGLHFGEDHDLHLRIVPHYRVGRTALHIMHDTSKLSLPGLLRKAYTYGASLRPYAAKHRRPPTPFPGHPKSLFIRHAGKLVREPVLAMGLFFIRCLEYLAGAMGFLSSLAGGGGKK